MHIRFGQAGRLALGYYPGLHQLNICVPPLQDEQRELAKTIRVSGSILLSTVSNFLDFFKMEAGKALDIVRTEVDVQVRTAACFRFCLFPLCFKVCFTDGTGSLWDALNISAAAGGHLKVVAGGYVVSGEI